EVEWCLPRGFQQGSVGWVGVVDLSAEGDGDDGGRAGVFEGMGHGLGSCAGDPQVFQQENPVQWLVGCEWWYVEPVAYELACVAVRLVRCAGDQRQRAVCDLDDLLERMDAGSRPGRRHRGDMSEWAACRAFQAFSVGVEEQRVQDRESELRQPV